MLKPREPNFKWQSISLTFATCARHCRRWCSEFVHVPRWRLGLKTLSVPVFLDGITRCRYDPDVHQHCHSLGGRSRLRMSESIARDTKRWKWIRSDGRPPSRPKHPKSPIHADPRPCTAPRNEPAGASIPLRIPEGNQQIRFRPPTCRNSSFVIKLPLRTVSKTTASRMASPTSVQGRFVPEIRPVYENQAQKSKWRSPLGESGR